VSDAERERKKKQVSTMNEDAADRQGPLHAGGHWRDTAGRIVQYSLSSSSLFRSDKQAEYCDDRVCLCVCVCVCLSVRDHISETTRPIFTKVFVHATCGHGSVLRWRRCNTFCTSGFMDDVMFAHKPRLLDVAAQLSGQLSVRAARQINRHRFHSRPFRFYVYQPWASCSHTCASFTTQYKLVPVNGR